MTGVLVAVVIVFLLLQMRCGVRVHYEKAETTVSLRIGVLHFRLFPQKKIKQKKEKKIKKKRRDTPQKQNASTAKKPKLELIRDLFPLFLETARGFRRKLCIECLILNIVWGGDDPADVAIGYGVTCAAVGVLLPQCEEHFDLRKKEVHVTMDNRLDKPEIFFEMALSLTLWQLLALGSRLGIQLLRLHRSNAKKKNKGEVI